MKFDVSDKESSMIGHNNIRLLINKKVTRNDELIFDSISSVEV